MLAVRSLRKAHIPISLLGDPSPGSVQPTRLALHVKGDGGGDSSSCSIYVASGCQVYSFEVSDEGSSPVKGKDSLLVPAGAQITHSSVVDRCPHHSEIQSVALAEGDYDTCLILGTVDSFGRLIVSRLDANGEDIDRHSYSIAPRGYGVGEGSWAGICFSPTHSSRAATVHSLCKSIDVYDQDIHLRNFQTWSALSRWVNCSKYEITGLAFSSLNSDYMYVQGVDYEVFCGRWKESRKTFSFRGDSNWLGFSKDAKADVLAGWCDSGSILVADVVKEQQEQPIKVGSHSPASP